MERTRRPGNTLYVLVAITGLGILLLSGHSSGESQRETGLTDEPRYVTLTFPWIQRDMPPEADLLALVEEIKKEFGARSEGCARYVGFSPGLIHALNLPPEVLGARVIEALNVAESTGIPVFFHFDEMHFWYDRQDLYNDPENVEWSAFPKEGEPHGPVIPRYWLNWGDWEVFPAPPPCFESPKFRADAKHRLEENIARPIVERLKRWGREGKDYLFAGIATGNESEVIPDLRPLAGTVTEGKEPEGRDITKEPPVKVRMHRNEMVRGGYAALHWRGYTAQSIARLAEKQNKTTDQVTTELLHEIAHDYAEFRSEVLAEAGIARERIYTHFVSPFRPYIAAMTKAQKAGSPGATFVDRFPPVKHAVNPYSRPGFTVRRDMVYLPDLIDKIEAASGRKATDLGWAGVETYPSTGQPGRKQTQSEFEEYLGAVFAHGARVWNVYAWISLAEAPDSPFIVNKNPGVIQAIRNWVNGKDLPAAWKGSPPGQARRPIDFPPGTVSNQP